eukprot:12157526-Alexandrium_andersonii.AAC.1
MYECLRLARESAGQRVIVLGDFNESLQGVDSFLGTGFATLGYQRLVSAPHARGHAHIDWVLTSSRLVPGSTGQAFPPERRDHALLCACLPLQAAHGEQPLRFARCSALRATDGEAHVDYTPEVEGDDIECDEEEALPPRQQQPDRSPWDLEELERAWDEGAAAPAEWEAACAAGASSAWDL